MNVNKKKFRACVNYAIVSHLFLSISVILLKTITHIINIKKGMNRIALMIGIQTCLFIFRF